MPMLESRARGVRRQRGRLRRVLHGAAINEIVDGEALGGAEMHSTVSGVSNYLVGTEQEALAKVRDILAALRWPGSPRPARLGRPPLFAPAELGVVAEVKVAPGQEVEAGRAVIVLESMKLFMSLTSGIAGTVAEIACRPGETVPAGKRLVGVRPPHGAR